VDIDFSFDFDEITERWYELAAATSGAR